MCQGTIQKALSSHVHVDIDECSSADLNLCTQLCNNTEGSYLCHCTTGYFLDPTDRITCHGNLNATAVISLSHIPNWYSKQTINVKNIDVDECADNEGSCPPNSDCINTHGSYNCKCNSLFEVQGDGSEMNECHCK